MLRETRRPKGDPKVLAAKSREQYFKVLGSIVLVYCAEDIEDGF